MLIRVRGWMALGIRGFSSTKYLYHHAGRDGRLICAGCHIFQPGKHDSAIVPLATATGKLFQPRSHRSNCFTRDSVLTYGVSINKCITEQAQARLHFHHFQRELRNGSRLPKAPAVLFEVIECNLKRPP